MNFSLQRGVAWPWTAGYVTYMLCSQDLREAGGQLVLAVRTGCVQGSTELSHLSFQHQLAHPCHSWDGQVGKLPPMSSPSPGPGQVLAPTSPPLGQLWLWLPQEPFT